MQKTITFRYCIRKMSLICSFRNAYIFVLLYFIFTHFLISKQLFAQIGHVAHSFSGPGVHPTGIAYDGINIWVADLSTDRLYKLNPINGNVISSLNSPGSSPTGLTWNNQFLWCCDNATDKIYRLDPNNGTILQILSIPSEAPRGITFVDSSLYYQDNVANKIFKLDPNNGNILDEFSAPSSNNRGLAWDGNYLWCVDKDLYEIYQVDLQRNKVVTILKAPGTYSYGLTWDGAYLWHTDYETNKIYKIQITGNELFHTTDPKQMKIRYTISTWNSGTTSMQLQTFMPVPRPSPFQRLLSLVQFSPTPHQYLIDNYNQRVAFYDELISPGDSIVHQMEVDAEIYNSRYYYLAERVGILTDIPAETLAVYTVDGEKYKIYDSVIVNAVNSAIGVETNVYWMARNIHDYIISNIEYLIDGTISPAPQVLLQGHGSCSEYSFAFIAMCRAAGIPAKYEGGGHARDSLPYTDKIYHRWAYVYLPLIGWVPVDCTWDDRIYPANQARYFGGYLNEVFATTINGGGSNYMGWVYNVRQTYTGGNREYTKKMEFLTYTTSIMNSEDNSNHKSELECSIYPNPFNNNVNIKIYSANEITVKIEVFDLLGKSLGEVYNGNLCEGITEMKLNIHNKIHPILSTGIYFVKITSNLENRVMKLVYLQ